MAGICTILLPTAPTAHAQATNTADRKPPAWTTYSCPAHDALLQDGTFFSKVFDHKRHYRIFLPPDYNSVTTRYPVIYYFHGSSDRYTLEDYDHGTDTVPKICRFVAHHPVIVVAVDGYIASQYTGFYNGMPYEIELDDKLDFGPYFLEQVHYIDTHYRTLTDRQHRATSGLSMGAFMSFYISARYPALIGSMSGFNPGPEFYVGDTGRRSLWRPKDHVSSYWHTPVRLIHASGDYISQYTLETESAFAPAWKVPFQYRQDEYKRHWATSIGETFAFHMKAFADTKLDQYPTEWNYASAFNSFHAWNYQVRTDIVGPAVIYLNRVHKGGLSVETRKWAPDGPPAECSRIEITTAPIYQPGATYSIRTLSLQSGGTGSSQIVADSEGQLHLEAPCGGEEIGFSGPGIDAQPPVLLPVTKKDFLRMLPGTPHPIPVRIWNPNAFALKNLKVDLTSEYPTVNLLHGSAEVASLGAGEAANLGQDFRVQFTAGNNGFPPVGVLPLDGGFAQTRLLLNVKSDNSPALATHIDVMVAPANLKPPEKIVVLDGRMHTFPIFWQDRNGGGKSTPRTVSEGHGNGNGILEPGEQATVWIQLAQGIDPFDKGNWCRTKIYPYSPWITVIGDIQENKRLEWTGAQNRTSLIELSPKAPKGAPISALLDCESYSYYWTPDVRYGKKKLYQPFQIHQHSIFLWKWKVGEPLSEATLKPEP